MARAILITFKDNEAAEAFVKSVWESQSPEAITDGTNLRIGFLVAAHARVRWMIAQPTQACKCNIKPNTGKGKFNNQYEQWRQTERFGWRVHARCNKPNFFVVRDFIRNLHVGYKNLLQELREVPSETDQATGIGTSTDGNATNSAGDANADDTAGPATADGPDHVQPGSGTDLAIGVVSETAGHPDVPSQA